MGCEGWGYDDVLPYFRRAEDNERGERRYHGVGGPLSVSRRAARCTRSSRRSSRPAAQAGHASTTTTSTAREQDGVGRYQVTQRDGMRCSTAVAYLHPALARDEPRRHHRRPRAADPVRGRPGRRRRDRPRRRRLETSAPSARSSSRPAPTSRPQMLMLSGIGPAERPARWSASTVRAGPPRRPGPPGPPACAAATASPTSESLLDALTPGEPRAARAPRAAAR